MSTDEELIDRVEQSLLNGKRPNWIRKGNDGYWNGIYVLIEDTQTRKAAGEILIKLYGPGHWKTARTKWVHFTEIKNHMQHHFED